MSPGRKRARFDVASFWLGVAVGVFAVLLGDLLWKVLT